MAPCCTTSRCSCRVVAGPGVTVDGDGSTTAPYVIGATGDGGAPTALTVTDSPTVDLALTGIGTAADPYELAAEVVVDPAPPGGGDELLQSGPGGLSLTCNDVRGCISAEGPATYDPATGVIGVAVSGDAGNQVAAGTDGGLYVPPGGAGEPTVVQAGDSTTVDTEVTGTGTTADPYVVTSSVLLDPAPPGGGGNLLRESPDGLYVECADVRTCFSAEGPATYDPATGEIGVQLSADPGNATTLGTDGGLFTPAPAGTALQATDTNTVDTTVTGSGTAGDPYVVEADAIVAPEPNGLEAGPDGLLVAPSADAGNELVIGADGRLFVPAPPPLEIGCGLQGAGTAASPLAALPIAGARLWADDWGCDAAANSTLHCDPDTGALWTPPDHYTAEDHIYVEHFNGGFATPITNTGGWAIIDPGASQSFAIPANFQGNQCRTWGFVITASGTWDINHTADAAFQLGYVEVYDGNPATVRPLWGPITALGAARRTRDNGTVTDSGWNIPAASGRTVTLYPAINVTAGSVTINSWVTDATIITTTNTP